jgi:hypothetical protein
MVDPGIDYKLNFTNTHNKTGSREVHTTTTQIESTATCPDKIVTKTKKVEGSIAIGTTPEDGQG